MKTQTKYYQAGFTLIEFIVTLVIAAIAATMVYAYMGSMLTKSSEPIFRLQKASNLHQVMENIVADYNRLNALNLRYKWQASIATSPGYSVGSVVVPPTNNGYYYTCTTPTSGSTMCKENVTTWPTTGIGSTHVTSPDGQWTASGYVWIATPTVSYVPGATIVVPYYNNGHFYKCKITATAAQCATAVTTWNTSPDSTTLPGNYWTEAGTILSSASVADNLSTLLPAVGYTKIRYGTGYTVTEKTFVKFTGTAPTYTEATADAENNILKVTIKDDTTSETLSELFTIR